MSRRKFAPSPFALRIDPYVAIAALTLLGLGVIMMTSASISTAERAAGASLFFLQRQVIFTIAAFTGAGFILLVPTRVWSATGYLALLAAFSLLIVVLVPGVGHTVNGSTRWINLGLFNLQVSEPARLLLLIYLSSYLVRHAEEIRTSFIGFAKPMLVLVLACVLLLAEPDFGAATVLMGAALGVMFVAGVRLRDYLFLLLASAIAFASLALSSPYRLKRLTSFLDPWSDPFEGGFQLTQSLIAIGRGEWFGVGLGGSVQKLFYLPEAHTDFVFAVMAEELGLFGASLTIALFLVLVIRGCTIARRAARNGQEFQSYLAYGLSIWIGLQAFINIGVNMGVLPTKGLTLPLMSYGGSSLIVSVAAVALLLRIHHETAADAVTNTRRARPRRVRA